MPITTSPGLRVGGSRATKIIPPSPAAMADPRYTIRTISMDDFIETKASGTLRKLKALGLNTASHGMHELVAYVFGYPFVACPERFVTWGEARSQPDESSLTEMGWHVERYASMCLVPGDEMECKYITSEIDGRKREGIGIVIRKTSVQWLPPGHIVFAIIAELDQKTHEWLPAVNPC